MKAHKKGKSSGNTPIVPPPIKAKKKMLQCLLNKSMKGARGTGVRRPFEIIATIETKTSNLKKQQRYGMQIIKLGSTQGYYAKCSKMAKKQYISKHKK